MPGVSLQKSTGSLLSFALVLLLSSACGPADPARESGGPSQPAGHRQMIETLRRVAGESRQMNPFLGERKIPEMRADLAALTDSREDLPKRWLLNLLLGKNELRMGREQIALEHYLEAYRLLGASLEPVPRENYLRTLFELSVAFLRQGETENCVTRNATESCIFPIRGTGVHRFREGSRNAAHYLTELLEAAPPDSLGYLRAVWLLNIAYMTLGEYPGGVPEAYRIPPERFAGDEPFPLFVNIAPQLSLAGFDLSGGVVAEDFNGDGLLDLMTSTNDTEGQMRLYLTRGDGSFEDRTRAAGLTGLTGGLNMSQGDYDGDGHVDVLVLRGGWWRSQGRHPNSLLHNNGDGTFTDVTYEAGLGEVHYPTQTAAWADYDLDGDLDLYIGNEAGTAMRFDDANALDTRAPCQLFRNNGDRTFTDVAAEAGVENFRYAKGVVWGDYDDDRYPDLYVSNLGAANRLYRNRGDGTFHDVASELSATGPIYSFPVWFWDADNDGALDVFVAAYGGPGMPPDVGAVAASYVDRGPVGELPALYLGDGRGGLREAGVEWGLTAVNLPMGANHGDADNDGFPDFYLGTGYPYYEGLMPNLLYRNMEGRGFADVTTPSGTGHLQKGHGVLFADLDNDGDQDIYGQIGGAYPGDGFGNALFRNPGLNRHWIKIRVVGKRSNRQGVGCRIRADVVEGGSRRSIYAHVDTGSSFGGNPLRKELGLGRAESIVRLEIYWPASDSTQVFEDVSVDQFLEVTEGASEFRVLPHPTVSFGR